MRAWIMITAAMAPAAATHSAERGSPETDKLVACTTIAEDKARLVCLDHEVAVLAANIAAGSVAVVSRSGTLARTRAQFGLAPRADDIFKDKNGAAIASINGLVKSARMDAYNKWGILLADGSRWQQVDDYALSGTPRPGQKVRITRAAIGTFKLAVENQASIRVRREF